MATTTSTERVVPLMKRFTAITIVERANEPGIEASATITTDAVDREHDIVNPKGMQPLRPGQSVPVLFGHDHSSLPIGVATAFAVGARGIRAGWRWAPHPFAKDVQQLWDEGYLNATSIGFRPIKVTPLDGGRGLRFDEWELLEFSIVPVPANPEAIRAMKRLKMDGPVSTAQASMLISELSTQLRNGKTLSTAHEQQLHDALVVLRTLTQAESVPPPPPDLAVIEESGSVIRIAPAQLASAISTVAKAEVDIALGRIPDDVPAVFRTLGDEPTITISNEDLAALVRDGLTAAVKDALRDLTGRVD
jgi:HK97 family phage prohead protease